MQISVIIPTYKAARYLPKLLEALHGQTLKPLEVILIDSSSPDGTAEIAKQAGCIVQVIPQSEFNHGATRNLGANMAQGEVLVFLTQDALPRGANYLEELTRPIRQGLVAGSYARQVPYPGAPPPEVFARAFNYPAEEAIRSADDIPRLGFKAFFFSNSASAVSRPTFEAVGRFPEHLIMDEDVYLCAKLLRAGHRVAYCPQAEVYHSHSYVMGEHFGRYFDIGVFIEQAGGMLAGAHTSGEGLRFMLKQTRYLLERRSYGWLGRAWLEAIAKFIAFNLGKRHQLLPSWLKPYLSMHKGFWQSEPGANPIGAKLK